MVSELGPDEAHAVGAGRARRRLPAPRTVTTGLGWAFHQGGAFGKEMRAVLHLASPAPVPSVCDPALQDNAAPIGVTTSLGYRPNGDHRQLRTRRRPPGGLRARAEAWQLSPRRHRHRGPEACLDLFGWATSPPCKLGAPQHHHHPHARHAGGDAMQRLTGLDAGFLSMETPDQPHARGQPGRLDPSEVEGLVHRPGQGRICQRRTWPRPFRRRLVEVPRPAPPLDRGTPTLDPTGTSATSRCRRPAVRRELAALAGHPVALPLGPQPPALGDGSSRPRARARGRALQGPPRRLSTVPLRQRGLSSPPSTSSPTCRRRRSRRSQGARPGAVRTPSCSPCGRPPGPPALPGPRPAPAPPGRPSTAPACRRLGTTLPPPGMFSAPAPRLQHRHHRPPQLRHATVSLPEVPEVNAFGVTRQRRRPRSLRRRSAPVLRRRRRGGQGPRRHGAGLGAHPGPAGHLGNRVLGAGDLATDVDDPVERLQAIQSHGHRQGAPRSVRTPCRTGPSYGAGAARPPPGWHSTMRMAGLHRPVFNVTISNVPGPPSRCTRPAPSSWPTTPVGPSSTAPA